MQLGIRIEFVKYLCTHIHSRGLKFALRILVSFAIMQDKMYKSDFSTTLLLTDFGVKFRALWYVDYKPISLRTTFLSITEI